MAEILHAFKLGDAAGSAAAATCSQDATSLRSANKKSDFDIEQSPYFFHVGDAELQEYVTQLREKSLNSNMPSSLTCATLWKQYPILFSPMEHGIKNRYIFTVFYYEYTKPSIRTFTHDVYVKPTEKGFYVFDDDDEYEFLVDEDKHENVEEKEKLTKGRFYETLKGLCEGEINLLEKFPNRVSWKTLRERFLSFVTDDIGRPLRKPTTPSDLFLLGLSAGHRERERGKFIRTCVTQACQLDPKFSYEEYQLVIDHLLTGRDLNTLASTAQYRETIARFLGCNESAICTILTILGHPIIDTKPKVAAAAYTDQSVTSQTVLAFITTQQRRQELPVDAGSEIGSRVNSGIGAGVETDLRIDTSKKISV